VLGKLTWFR